jgi:hypothetical protein
MNAPVPGREFSMGFEIGPFPVPPNATRVNLIPGGDSSKFTSPDLRGMNRRGPQRSEHLARVDHYTADLLWLSELYHHRWGTIELGYRFGECYRRNLAEYTFLAKKGLYGSKRSYEIEQPMSGRGPELVLVCAFQFALVRAAKYEPELLKHYSNILKEDFVWNVRYSFKIDFQRSEFTLRKFVEFNLRAILARRYHAEIARIEEWLELMGLKSATFENFAESTEQSEQIRQELAIREHYQQKLALLEVGKLPAKAVQK